MGFSLIGNSGDSRTTQNIYETSYSASLNPQLEATSPGSAALSQSPLVQGGGIGTYAPSAAYSYQNSPVNVVSTGSNTGDSALAALQGLQATQTAATDTTPGTNTPTSLSSILGANGIYYVLGAIVLLFLSHHKG